MKRSNAEKLLKKYYQEQVSHTKNNKAISIIEMVLKVAFICNFSLLLVMPIMKNKPKIDLSKTIKLYGNEINYIKNNFNLKEVKK